ncbi:MAG: hypothetical protein PSV16_13155 [Flavobacterium sp.]|nr:hypothetical protein [Flavobacterium sp.]
MRNYKITFNLFLILASINLYSQIGINTTDPKAQLEIKANSPATNIDGLIIPRVSVLVTSGMTSGQHSMLVYLTTTDGSNTPGFYYWSWNSTTSTGVWLPLGLSGWGLLGNAGTSATTNFLGTTDNNDMIFKRNSIMSGRLSTNNTSFGVSSMQGTSISGTNNSAFGQMALQNISSGSENTAVGAANQTQNGGGTANTSIGYGSLYANTVSGNNTAIGRYALNANAGNGSTEGVRNTAVGSNSVPRNTTGIDNVGIGSNVMYENTTGKNNVAIGSSALHGYSGTLGPPAEDRIAVTGNDNTTIGYFSSYFTSTATQNTAVGAFAQYRNKEGNYNAAFGDHSLFNNLASKNTAVGANSLRANTTGTSNTAVGYQALTTITTENKNSAFGYYADVAAGVTNATAIGYAAYAGISNSLILGSVPGFNAPDGSSNSYVNVGIGTTTPHASLQFSNTSANRKVVLTEATDNDHQYYGLGVNASVLRYQVSSTSDDHVFYAGTSSTTSQELARIKGSGDLSISGKILNESWTTPSSLSNSWINTGTGFNSLSYYKDKENVVHLKGTITGGTVSGSNEVFQLTTYYRPTGTSAFTAIDSNGGVARILINSSGYLYVTHGNSSYNISLDGISFRAD